MRHHWIMLLCTQAFACTDFILMDQNKQFVVGRTMEFGLDLKSEIIVSPAGGVQVSMIQGKKGMNWQETYAYTGLTALGQDQLIVDGMNEKGFSLGVLWFPDTVYPANSPQDLSHTISLVDVGRWLLSTCATVEDAKQALEQARFYVEKIDALGEVPPIHYSLHDATGSSLVVEFVDGKLEINKNPIGVLTNAPKFEWHMTNLRNYINLSPMNSDPLNLFGVTINPTGQGTGMHGLPGDWSPPSRFIKIALLKASVFLATNTKSNVNLAFHLLNTVDIPFGAIQNHSAKTPDYTQWSIVKDLKEGTLYIRTYDHLYIKTLTLSQALKKGSQKLKI